MATGTAKKGALIFMHGLGDTPTGWSSLEDQLPKLDPSLSDLLYVFPPSPTIPISINGGARMPGWFDLYDWPIGVGAKDDPEGMALAVNRVEAAIQDVETTHKIPRSKIVIGGFSQGGAIALLSAYKGVKDKPLGGCVCLSGWLTCNDQIVGVKDTPLFWGHGEMDDKVLFAQQAAGVSKLQEVGLEDIDFRSYSMGHSSHPQELSDMASFLVRIFAEKTVEKEL